jgi:TolB-like protein/tetratricopeptide (TPR) repeat protein/tRNA A-37 threonylcarbamoyl transferase component Bud32
VAAAELQDQLQAALGGSYTLERELGRGGMATVFLAVDTKHSRRVALKVLHANLATSLGPERFRREISFAAKLQHPHILTVMDSGESPTGQLWFTMPYVEGETLRARLRRQRQLPLDDALRIGHEVALALDYAHRHGVVHRDVKPENILLTSDGQALVADFGIARALSSAASPEAGGTGTLTQTGVAVGTPSYMSPEQASGERNLDGTTDVYSLGSVIYEMLAGEPPFTGPSAQAVIAKMMASDAPSVRRARPSVPEAVDAAIRKALAPVPADRFPTAGELAKALDTAQRDESRGQKSGRRRLPIAATALGLGFLVAAGILFAWRSHARTLAMSTGAVRLAVLPFENVGDPADAYFADGMSEEITARVSRVPGVNVIGRTSVLQYHRSGKTAPQFGRDLGVQYVLDGTVRWARASNGATHVRITPALIRVGDGTQVWGEPYDGVPADVFELQSDVAERVTQSLRGALLPGERRALRTAPTEDLKAYRLYLLGREGWRRRTPEGLQQAAADFQQAIDRDPNYAQAYAGLADVYAVFWEYGIRTLPRDTAYARATAAASRALTLDSTLAEGHAALGQIQVNLWRWPEAERELRRAIELDQNYASAHQWYAEYLMMQGRLDEALAEASTAIGLDPLAGIVANAYGLSLSAKGRTGEAISVYRAALARDSTLIFLRRDLCFTYVYMGRPGDALALLTAMHDTSTMDRDFVRARLDPAARRRAIANMHLGIFGAFEYSEATGFALLGEPDSAFATADRALAAHDENLGYMKSEPMWASLHADPRFAAVMRRMGLPP